MTRLRLAPDLAGLDEDIAGELPKLSCGSPPRSPPSWRWRPCPRVDLPEPEQLGLKGEPP